MKEMKKIDVFKIKMAIDVKKKPYR